MNIGLMIERPRDHIRFYKCWNMLGLKAVTLFVIYLGIMWFDLCHITSGETQELGILVLMAFHFTSSLLIDSNQFLGGPFTHFRRCLIKWNSMWFKTCSFWKVSHRLEGEYIVYEFRAWTWHQSDGMFKFHVCHSLRCRVSGLCLSFLTWKEW